MSRTRKRAQVYFAEFRFEGFFNSIGHIAPSWQKREAAAFGGHSAKVKSVGPVRLRR